MSKKYRDGDYEATHQNPVWRDKANFIIAAYLGEKDGRGEWEQLWVIRLDDRHFSLCCIPFFVYDLALGDEVETDESYVMTRVTKSSGRYTFRVWFGTSTTTGIKDGVVSKMMQVRADIEWSSENLLAISAADADQAQVVADYLHSQHSVGALTYETGRTR